MQRYLIAVESGDLLQKIDQRVLPLGQSFSDYRHDVPVTVDLCRTRLQSSSSGVVDAFKLFDVLTMVLSSLSRRLHVLVLSCRLQVLLRCRRGHDHLVAVVVVL